MINVEIKDDKVAFLSYTSPFKEIEIPMLARVVHQIKKLGGNVEVVVLDISSIKYVNAAGISVLLRIRRFCQDKELDFKLASPTEWVRYVLALTKIDTIIQYA